MFASPRDLQTCRSRGVRKRARSGETSHVIRDQKEKAPSPDYENGAGLFATILRSASAHCQYIRGQGAETIGQAA